MAKLTSGQINFLKEQSISTSLVFDASGYSKSERLELMDKNGTLFYFGDALCKKGGHGLRTKSGHCIECDTKKIAFQLRSSAAGYVYLAHSKSTNLIKVGFSKHHPQDRVNFLRNEGYGNIRDWDIKRIAKLDHDAGKIEFAIHGKLEKFLKPIIYKRSNEKVIECREIFSCDLQTALYIFESVTKNTA